MEKLKFTVVTVTYNAEKNIENTIKSVLNQEYKPYEYLIIDGASEDNTLDIINSYQKQFKEMNIKYIIKSEKDAGIYNAMNKGVDLATGEFISFLNAGDWYEFDALKKINDYYNKNEFDLTYGGLNYINPNGSVTKKMSKKDKYIISSRNWNHPSMFLKNELYKKYKFNEKYKIYADFDLYLKLRKEKIRIEIIDEIITNFVADGISTNTNIKKVFKRAKEKFSAYIDNGYSHLYFIESYGWEIIKALYFKIKSN